LIGVAYLSAHAKNTPLSLSENPALSETGFWETEAGRRWVTRLVVATLYTFGLKRGVGLETMSEFFARLRLERHMGCSASALGGVMHALERAILEIDRGTG